MQKARVGFVIIANAIVWGAVIIGCSLALKGTGMYHEIQYYLSTGAAVTTLIIFGGVFPLKKKEEEADGPEQKG